MRLDIMPYRAGPFTRARNRAGIAGLACMTCPRSGLGCAGCGKRGLGEWEAIAGSVLSSFARGGGGGGGSGMPSIANRVDVNPNIITSVSPQISPTFQQQFQPTNSAATAGTSMGVPDSGMPALGVGNTNWPAGYPIAQPYAAPVAAPVVTTGGQLIPGIDNTTLAVVGVLGLLLMSQSKKKNGSKKHSAHSHLKA